MTFDEVYQFASLPQDDVYDCQECIQECDHAGELSCPSFRTYLVKAHHHEKPEPIKETCVHFVSWRDASRGWSYM